MNKNVFAAVFVGAMLVSTSQASAMVENAGTVHLNRKGVCKIVENSDVVDVTIFGSSSVSVSVTLEVNYANGQKREVAGTPVFIFSNNEEAFRAQKYEILKEIKGKFPVTRAGFFRVIPAEIQTVDYPVGVNTYNVLYIKVCAQ